MGRDGAGGAGGEGGAGGAGPASTTAAGPPAGHVSSGASGSGSTTSSGSTAAGTGPGSSSASGHASSGAGGASCDDVGPGEPNDTEASAVVLGEIDDCDESGSKTSGVLAGPNDVDWYRYVGDDDIGCVVDPQRDFAIAGGAFARICKFVECASGATDASSVQCPDGTAKETSPSGRPGCCDAKPFAIDVDCSGLSDDATIYLRVDEANADCVAYELGYHY